VLNGTASRLAAAERIAAALPAAPQCRLIRCPGQPVPAPQALPELLHGFDTATQITAQAQWLQRQQRPLTPRHPGGSAAPTARPHRTPQTAARCLAPAALARHRQHQRMAGPRKGPRKRAT